MEIATPKKCLAKYASVFKCTRQSKPIAYSIQTCSWERMIIKQIPNASQLQYSQIAVEILPVLTFQLKSNIHVVLNNVLLSV